MTPFILLTATAIAALYFTRQAIVKTLEAGANE